MCIRSVTCVTDLVSNRRRIGRYLLCGLAARVPSSAWRAKDPVLKYCSASRGWLAAASLLLPLAAAAESHLQAATASGKASATAHLDFRIVIPKVLSLHLADIDTRGTGAQRVTIYSNSRNVTLAASTSATSTARNNVILRATAGRVIARDAACQLPADASRGVSPKTNGLICTVSMP